MPAEPTDPTATPVDLAATWRGLRRSTLAMFVLVALVAFESLAVTTVMPTVAALLDGRGLYSLAFAGPVAAGVVGMVAGGIWCDRSGPRVPLTWAIALFSGGLLVAGTAASMEVLVAGRLVQGLGGGAMTVCIFVIVGRLYPAALQPRVFAWFAAAWVLPSIVGPTVAGVITEYVHWRWVFLGAAVLAVPVWLTLQPGIRTVRDNSGAAAGTERGRLVRAVALAAAVLALGLSAQLTAPASWLVAATCLVLAVAVARTLLPRGTLLANRGLPAVIASRLLVNGAFFGSQIYVPYLLTENFGFSPATAGIGLTTAALAWFSASWLQGRLVGTLESRPAIVVGSALVTVAVAGVMVAAAVLDAPAALIAAWTLAGAGMGLAYPRMAVLVLGYSSTADQGANTAAMSIADSLGIAGAVAVTGLLAAGGGEVSAGPMPAAVILACLGFTVALGAAAVAVAPRVARRGTEPGLAEVREVYVDLGDEHRGTGELHVTVAEDPHP